MVLPVVDLTPEQESNMLKQCLAVLRNKYCTVKPYGVVEDMVLLDGTEAFVLYYSLEDIIINYKDGKRYRCSRERDKIMKIKMICSKKITEDQR